jgi:hypothetical protein
MAGFEEAIEAVLVLAQLLHRHRVQHPVGRGKNDRHLLFNRERLILRLLQDLDEALAAVELALGGLVQVAAELRECRELAVLRKVESQRARTWRIALICAEPPTRDTELPTLIAGRMPWLNRSDSRKIWPSVIEMTLVGMYAERSPACVSMIGSAVSDPPPRSALSLAARSSRRECR